MAVLYLNQWRIRYALESIEAEIAAYNFPEIKQVYPLWYDRIMRARSNCLKWLLEEQLKEFNHD